MQKTTPSPKRIISFDTMSRLCSAILDTGFLGNAEDFFREIDKRDMNTITEAEAEELIRHLENFPGSLAEE